MRRPPRAPDEPLFSIGRIAWSLGQGAIVLVLVATLFSVALYRGLSEEDARALTFATLVATNLGLVLVNRSGGESLRTAFRRRNPALWWVGGASGALLAAVLAFAPARNLFHFGRLHADDVALALASGCVVLLILILAKRMLVARMSLHA